MNRKAVKLSFAALITVSEVLTQCLIFFSGGGGGRVVNIVGKGENAGYQHFLLFPQCFQEAFYSGSLKVGIVW